MFLESGKLSSQKSGQLIHPPGASAVAEKGLVVLLPSPEGAVTTSGRLEVPLVTSCWIGASGGGICTDSRGTAKFI